MQDQDQIPESQQLDRFAADGGRIVGAANNAGDFINMLEDGQFSADLNRDLADLAATMSDMALATGKKQRGKVTITIDFTHESVANGAMFLATAKHVVKAPEEKRRASVLFTDENNRFTRTQPRHGQFFGIRTVEASAREVRTV
jgi:hypothetical protein